jgi:hypothetical protein
MLGRLIPTAVAVASLNSGVEVTAIARATRRSLAVSVRQMARINGAASAAA